MYKQNRHYQQLTHGLRYQISALRQLGMTPREIADVIGVHYSTISRDTATGYEPEAAQRSSELRKRTSAKANKRSDKADKIIRESILIGWSPESISSRMKLEFSSNECLSRCTIYRRVEEERRQGGTLYRYLTRFGKTRRKGGKRNKNAGVRLIPNRVDITERPGIVDRRKRLGDWEGDTVHGQYAHLVTLVDRINQFSRKKNSWLLFIPHKF